MQPPTTIADALILNAGEPAFRGDIVIDGDLIVSVERGEGRTERGVRTIDARNRIAIPGLVNAHTHSHGSLGKGLSDRWTLELLLNAASWTSGGLTHEERYLAAMLNAAEMVMCGVTAAYDLFVQVPCPDPEALDAVARGYAEVGVRLVLAPMMADISFYRAVPGLLDALAPSERRIAADSASEGWEKQIGQLRAWLGNCGRSARFRPALGPTIPNHCSDAFLRGCAMLAEEFDVGVQMHLAESRLQVVGGAALHDMSLVRRLERLGLLGPRFVGAHGVWLDDDDLDRLAASGSGLVHNPGSNLRLGAGVAAVRPMRDRAICVGLGTDGSISSDHQNMFEAMRLASYLSRVLSPDPERWLSAEDALTMATTDGARILGMSGEIGRIAPGHRADIVLLDAEALAFTPLNDVLLQLVQSADSSVVDTVIIGGSVVLEGRRFRTLDLDGLRRRCAATVEGLMERNADRRAIAETLAPVVQRHCLGLAGDTSAFACRCGSA